MRALFDDVSSTCAVTALRWMPTLGHVNCCKYALPYLAGDARLDRSHLVGGGPPRSSRPHAAIFGLEYAMTASSETLRIENAAKAARVIACPGFTASTVRFAALRADGTHRGETPRDEAKMMTPEQVGPHRGSAAPRRKRPVDGGRRGAPRTLRQEVFAPAFLDRMFYMVTARGPIRR